MQKAKTESRIKVYYELTKPKIWYLLVFTAFAAAITASNIYEIEISPITWALMLGGVAAGSAAARRESPGCRWRRRPAGHRWSR